MKVCKDATKKQYGEIYLQLLAFQGEVKSSWPDCDYNLIQSLLDTIRFWRQFAPSANTKTTRKGKNSGSPLFKD